MPARRRFSAALSPAPLWATAYAPAAGAQPLTAAQEWTRQAVAPTAPTPEPKSPAPSGSA